MVVWAENFTVVIFHQSQLHDLTSWAYFIIVNLTTLQQTYLTQCFPKEHVLQSVKFDLAIMMDKLEYYVKIAVTVRKVRKIDE